MNDAIKEKGGLESGQEVTFSVEPETSILQRLITRLFSIFVPERQL